VKSISLVSAVLGFALVLPAGAQTTGKVGVISIQGAIAATKDGQKAASDIQARFNPKRAELEKRQTEIGQLQDQLNRGRNTLSDDARQQLVRDIDQKNKALTRATEDTQAEFDQEQQKIMGELYRRIMAVVDKYAKDNGYNLILDVSSPQTPVLYASSAVNITKDVIDLYDKNEPAATSAAPVKPAAQPPASPPPKPVAPPKKP
jgi:outer membrane protein